ncbi:ABC transporter ATP-binding protein [Rhizobium leguminosarum]|uniref:ABC transporter ATP-binding protein n=1 Tax=Rhizobium leguminosarum TaxID=384 RepID=UPI0021B09D93|nr:ABC transporter ATP-binding protein [Rhizobium leguminosarum]
MQVVLEVKDICIGAFGRKAEPIVKGVSFDLHRGEILGLVGESGSGKTLSALSQIGLLPKGLSCRGHSHMEGEDGSYTDQVVRARRGKRIAMIFQNPMTAFNPFFRLEQHFIDACRIHRGMDARSARSEAQRTIQEVGLPTPELLLRNYPHQLSGGQLQRVGIALALVCRPDVLIADEPTTALDVTVQAQIAALLVRLTKAKQLSIIFITHDLSLVNAICDRVVVMRLGEVCEIADKHTLFRSPSHPYTKQLIRAVPVPRYASQKKPRPSETISEGCSVQGSSR